MKYKYGTRRKAAEYEKAIAEWWKKNRTFEKSVEQRSADNAYVFYDGPPFITGVPHYGTLLSSVIKDVIPRYQTMKGKRVERVWGWDCHGLPAENFTEKHLNGTVSRKAGGKPDQLILRSGDEVKNITLEEYVKTARHLMVANSATWGKYIDRIGRWVDFKGAYRTMDKGFMESVWWAFAELYKKGKIYEGEKVLMYDTKFATPVSKAEVTMDNDAYQTVTDPSVFVRFKLRESKKAIKNDKIIKIVKNLGFPLDEVLVFASGVMDVYDLRKSDDIDLVVSKKVFEKIKKSKDWVSAYKESADKVMYKKVVDGIEIETSGDYDWVDWYDEKTGFTGLIERAENIDGVNFNNFHDLLAWKRSKNRPKDQKDIELIEEFLIDGEKYLLAWTTTPWTLPANMALAVNPKLKYVEVAVGGENWILARDLLVKVLVDEKNQPLDYKIVREMSGKDLVSIEYFPLLPEADSSVVAEKSHKVYPADFVGEHDGTGIVHIAPAYGENDFALAEQYGIPVKHVIDDNGYYFNDTAKQLRSIGVRDTDQRGIEVWAANKFIAKCLEEAGVVWKIDYIRHEYPFNPRSKQRIMYRAIKTWFMDIQGQKPLMLAENQNINWFPPHIKNGRFAKNIDQAPDWALSRNRFWATAMPVWKGDRGSVKVIGSYAELEELSGVKLDDYHRPWVDRVEFDLTLDGKSVTKKPVNVTYFVHGTTTDNEAHKSTGWNDGELSALGVKQSEELAKIVKSQKFDAIFSSDLGRAVESAKLNFPDAEIIQDERLRECNYGDLNGADSELVVDLDHIDKPFPNGESMRDVEKRIRDFCDFLAKNYAGKRVAVVAHKAPQFAFQVVTENRTWANVIKNDWREIGKWQAGWEYWVEADLPIKNANTTTYILCGGRDRKYDDFGKKLAKEITKIVKKPRILDVFFSRPEVVWQEKFDERMDFYDEYFSSYSHEMATLESFYNQVAAADVIFFHGGSAKLLMENLPDFAKVKDAISGKIYIGSSAGAEYIAEHFPFLEIDAGSGILPINVATHYKSDWEEYNIQEIDAIKLEKKYPRKTLRLREGEFEIVRTPVETEHFTRIEEVLDGWFESGSMPFAQFHYPFENKEKFEQNYPADFITEYVAQVRAWFYYVHAVNTALFGDEAFANVIVTGTIAGNDGRKMSKSLGNYTDPMALMDKYSADSLRFLLASSPLLSGEDFSLKDKDVGDVARKLAMIWNMYDFFTMYAEVDGWEYCSEQPPILNLDKLNNPLDKWIISRVHQLNAHLTKYLDEYNLPEAMSAILPLLDDASNWYVRRSRRRFWKSEDDADKNQAYQTLHYVLTRLAILLAPFTPFLAEELYQKMVGGESVHLLDWPSAGEIDHKVLSDMSRTRAIIEKGLALRMDREDQFGQIKVRQPLARLTYNGDKLDEFYEQIIADEVNVKSVVNQRHADQSAGDDSREVSLDKKLTPVLKREGQAREVIRVVQQQRKAAGLNVDDRIVVNLTTPNKELQQAITDHKDTIAAEILATKFAPNDGFHTVAKIDGAELTIQLAKAT